MSIRSFFVGLTTILVILGWPIAAPAQGQNATGSAGLPAKTLAAGSSTNEQAQALLADVQAKLDALATDAAVDTTQKERLTATYRATIEAIRAYGSDTEKIATLAKSATLAADKLAVARERLKQAAAVFDPPADADGLSIEELRQRRSESDAALTAARQSLQTLETIQRDREVKRAQLPKLIADGRAAIEVAETAPVAAVEDDPQGTLKAAREVERAIKLLSMKQSVEALAHEQATIVAEAELLPAQIDEVKNEVAFTEQRFRFWSEKLGKEKQYQIENDLAAHREQLAADKLDPEQSLVLARGIQWIEVIREQSQLERKLAREQARTTEISEALKSARKEIDSDLESGSGLRSGLGLKLQLARTRLPTSADMSVDMKGIDELIDRGRSLQTTIELALEDARLDTLTGITMQPHQNLPMRGNVVDPTEVSLLKQMKTDIDLHLSTLVEIKNQLELKRKAVSAAKLLIESHVVWIRNSPPFKFADLSSAWWAFRRIVHPSNLQSVGRALVSGVSQRFDLILIWTVFGLTLWCLGSRLRRRLFKVGDEVHEGIVNGGLNYSLTPTMIALLITIALAIPPVATLAVIGYAILEAANKDNYISSVGSAFVLAGMALFPMETLRQMLRPGGLAISHFGYRSEIVLPPRTSLRLLIDIGIPLMIVWAITNESGRLQRDASLGRIIFAFGMVVLSYLLWQSLHPRTGLLSDYMNEHPDGWAAKLKRLWYPMVSWLPIVLAVLSLIGYSYTATLLTGKLYWTLWLSIGVLVLGGLLRQWFVTHRRRMATTVRVEQVVESTLLDGSPIEIERLAPIDVAEMNAQSLRLIQALMWLVGLVGLVLIWSPVFPAVRFLDSVPLWDTTAADGTRTPVTLANLIFAFPIVLLSFIAFRNLPGLLESVLLARLPLDRAARYATTTLASYAIALIGMMLSAQTLGLRWDNIQWLVAALSVGLGFGLQEIFANFISGLILLFEQPIRVGDVVTIDGVTGTVTRIRMRATAVTNYDRQELIIPNKDLITGRLINWTLTDSTNRVALNIGIAYGSDTRKACQLLEQICAQHENLLVDPPPVVTFEGFGDSTLNLVVRCYLGSLDMRLKTIHELNTTINDRFAQEAIEIAFPQRDLHIRSLPPQFAAAIAAKTSVDI